ncbi:hypothetical protein BJB45_21690 [Halomonas huangheensis]|uniref:Uncharacterized protein n=1 Tax=Halomonas huangheensis TaxID=1178482 RepID=W1N1C2_9GAMM|nr:hypothetical protein AR456_12610 [Halomonas huangheensis]ERL49367.1 hypothetical protein BJB45_21690 [Halomonas huangheensis]
MSVCSRSLAFLLGVRVLMDFVVGPSYRPTETTLLAHFFGQRDVERRGDMSSTGMVGRFQ